jgi:hypothetical protein
MVERSQAAAGFCPLHPPLVDITDIIPARG